MHNPQKNCNYAAKTVKINYAKENVVKVKMRRQKGPAAGTRASGRPLHGVCFKIVFAGRNTGFGPQSPGFSRELCKKYSRCKAALSSSADEDSYGAVFADF